MIKILSHQSHWKRVVHYQGLCYSVEHGTNIENTREHVVICGNEFFVAQFYEIIGDMCKYTYLYSVYPRGRDNYEH